MLDSFPHITGNFVTRLERPLWIGLGLMLSALLAASTATPVFAEAPSPPAQPQSASQPPTNSTQQKVTPSPPPSAEPPQQAAPKPAPDKPDKKASEKKGPDPEQELRRVVEESANDRAALVRNLEEYLKRFPDTSRKVEIYRAIVESSMQLHDSPRALNYAERIVSLNPEDISITMLAIDLLEGAGDDAGLTRAIDYAGRVLDRIQKSPMSAKSPRVSLQDWEEDKKRGAMSVYLLRGRLWKLRRNYDAATQDLESSFKLIPNAPAAEQLAEIAELRRDFPRAIDNYATAFALGSENAGPVDRAEIRRKLGNVWKQVHGNETGLGEKILAAYDRTLTPPANNVRNKDAKQPLDFELRRVVSLSGTGKNDNTPEKLEHATQGKTHGNGQNKGQEKVPAKEDEKNRDQFVKLSDAKGKVVVLNFWATWCGPCRDLEPIFDALGRQYEGNPNVMFLAASSDEDESRVPLYMQRERIRSTVVFADGLDHHLGVNAFPTTIVLDRAGKVVYRTEGFDAETFSKTLNSAIQRALASGP